MVSDSFPEQNLEFGSTISLVLEFEEKQRIDIIYNCLSKNGTVIMELQDTFW
ncbi:VOC family protein [Priestia flexa]|jgi:PhnB protein|uniref:hypothetical protein n=1 Tax=Priestia flexa TaxID=86664 RepID=UPI002DB8E51B|nr:hypothetical protein [Priestia flexa]